MSQRGRGRGGYDSYPSRQGQESGYNRPSSGFSRGGGADRGSRGGGRGGSSRGGRGGHSYEQKSYPKPFSNAKIVTVKSSDVAAPQEVEGDAYVIKGSAGSAGKKISVVSNYYPIQLPKRKIYQYSVVFDTKDVGKRLANEMVSSLIKELKVVYVFDGQELLFILDKIDNIKTVLQRGDRNYSVTINYVKTLSSDKVDGTVLQVFNLVNRTALKFLKFTQINRNYFSMEDQFPVGDRNPVDVVPGLQQTIVRTARGLLSNRDVAWKTLRREDCLKIYQGLQRNYQGNELQRRFEDEVLHRIMYLPHTKRTSFITGVKWDMTPNSKFKHGVNNKLISFVEYYKITYKIDVNPNQPMLEAKRKNGIINYFVPEMCLATGLTDDMRNDRFLMKELKSATGLGPDDRYKSIAHTLDKQQENSQYTATLDNWGYKTEKTALEVPGRCLAVETIEFGKKVTSKVNEKAEWDMIRKTMYRVKHLEQWAIVYPPKSRLDEEDQSHEINKFVAMLKKVSHALGVTVTDPEFYPTNGHSNRDYENVVNELAKNTKFVVCILSDSSAERYNIIKRMCESRGLLSQCALWSTIESDNMSKTTKIAVQIATKLGAAPWSLQYNISTTMIIGMDVNHSGELVNKKKNSIGALCATMGGDQTSYYSDVIIQRPGQEIVEALQPVMEAALVQYKKVRGELPENILFLRDGVGEGQVQEVHRTEIQAIYKSIRSFSQKIKLTHMVVLKRINTRLAVWDQNGHLANPPAGTVVDTDIVNPNAIEFFMVAHYANQGTATPTKYQCLVNEVGWTSDQLQSIVFKLCHGYYNWFGGIRCPAPCQLAHKLAFLTGQAGLKGEKTMSNFLHYL